MRDQAINGGRKALATAGALLLAATLAPSITPADTALAADETRTYSWANGQSQPSIPQTIQGADGQTMTIVSQTQPVQADGSRSITQSFSESRNQSLSSAEIGNVNSIMPNSVYINSDGFSGNIPRTGIDQTPVMRTETQHLTQTESTTTTSNNRSAVSNTRTFNGRTYTLEDVSFTPARRDSQGNPLTYTARATYGADVSNEVVDHYNVTAHYQGDLTKFANEGDWSVSVVYHSDDRPAEQPREEENRDDDRNENRNENENENNNENENRNENENGVTTELNENENSNGFGDPENPNANANATSPFANRNSNDNAGNASNTVANENTGPEEKQETTLFGLPMLPLLIGAGILLAALLAAIIILAARKNKKKKKKKKTEQPQPVDPMVAAGVAGAGMAGAGFFGEAAAAGVAYEEEPVSQLIAIGTVEDADGNVDYEQAPRADLAVYPSRHESVPTLVKFPPMEDEDGERVHFEPEEDKTYWIAIDEDVVASAVSSDMLVSTDDNCEIYRGPLADQFELSTEQMAAALNGTLEGADISDELAAYDAIVPFEIAPPKMVPVEVPADAGMAYGDGFSDDLGGFGAGDADAAFFTDDPAAFGGDGFEDLDDMGLDELSFDATPSDEMFDDVDDFGGGELYEGFDDITIDADGGMPGDDEYFAAGEPLVFEDSAEPEPAEAVPASDGFDDFEDFDDLDGFTAPEPVDAPVMEPAPAQPAFADDDFSDVEFDDLDFGAVPSEPAVVSVGDLFADTDVPEAPQAQPAPAAPQAPAADVFDDLGGDFMDGLDDLDDLDFSDADFGTVK